MSVTVVTPTGDRPLAFGLLRDHWMNNQTVKPDQWVVVDDGDVPYDTGKLPGYVEYIRRDPEKKVNGHSIGVNLDAGLLAASGDNILIMEDDDWYAPTYIECMVRLLEKDKLAGLWGTNYYHVKIPGYREMGRQTHAALSMTAFRGSFLPQILYSIPGNISIDLRIWQNNRGLLVDGRNKKLQCSIKGLPGRENAGVGKIEKYYKKDVEYKKLRQWCGDAEIYIDLMERGVV